MCACFFFFFFSMWRVGSHSHTYEKFYRVVNTLHLYCTFLVKGHYTTCLHLPFHTHSYIGGSGYLAEYHLLIRGNHSHTRALTYQWCRTGSKLGYSILLKNPLTHNCMELNTSLRSLGHMFVVWQVFKACNSYTHWATVTPNEHLQVVRPY